VHQRQDVAIRIGEERHPEIVILHRSDPVRLAREGQSSLLEFSHGKGDVRGQIYGFTA
jgi:hypothetical protein